MTKEKKSYKEKETKGKAMEGREERQEKKRMKKGEKREEKRLGKKSYGNFSLPERFPSW